MHEQDLSREAASIGQVDLHNEDWMVGIGDDVACKFNSAREGGRPDTSLGRIIRMRKKGTGGRWLDYRRPVDIAGDRGRLGNLFFICYWYRQTRVNLTYTYSHADMEPVHVSGVICPVNMTYNPETNKYTVGAPEMQVVRASLQGASDIDMADVEQ